jgi:hypothetical protein
VRVLDLFCGRLGWSKAFLARGWEAVGIDLVEPPEIPDRFTFIEADILSIGSAIQGYWITDFDFICASSPCEQFSVHGMKHFHPNPPYPELGIKLFNHTRELCEASGVPYVMENVRAAETFVGRAAKRCGPFALWGSGVPPILPQGITKAKWRPNSEHGRSAPGNFCAELLLAKPDRKAKLATIPPELANCVADYAERLLEVPNGKH